MADDRPPVTVPDFGRWKSERRSITALTAYDYPTARLLDAAGIDCLLVGDSVGTAVQGRESTLSVTLDQMLYHTEMVGRAASRALVVADLPFLSYQISVAQALETAGRFLKETRCQAIKLEGGTAMAPTIRALTEVGIPVMGHIGLTPQAVRQLGGYKVQRGHDQILADARAVAEAGAFAVVLECVPSGIAAEVTAALSVPTIGIGAGPDCDGQILVVHDILGLSKEFRPKFVRRYQDIGALVTKAATDFIDDVRERRFPDQDESYR